MQINKINIRGKSYIILSVFILGFSSIITQLIAIREFHSVFSGNELIFGLLLSSWMALTALGALSGRFIAGSRLFPPFVVIMQLLLSILPAASIFLIRYLRFLIFPVGVALNLIEILLFALCILLPYCLIAGMMFTFYCKIISGKENKIGNTYFFESMGSVAGGALFSFVLIFFLNTYETLAIIFVVNLISALVLTIYFDSNFNKAHEVTFEYQSGKYSGRFIRYAKYIIPLLLPVLIIPFLINCDLQTKQLLYKNQKMLENVDTPYGNLVVTQTSEQLNFFEDGNLLFSTGNPIDNEEAVHYAMVQCSNPKSVLLVSGGVSGLANEILKYKLKKLDYVEINPYIIKLGKKYTHNIDDRRINAVAMDARIFVSLTNKKYDAVIINLPEPGTAQLNRYYSYEFFRELKSKLTPASVISLSLPSTENYVSKEASELNSSIYMTLKKVFRNIIIIPGGKNYLIASDMPLTYDIGKRIEDCGIENLYVNKYYYDEASIVQRAETIINSMNHSAKINYDFYPVSYYQQIKYWLSYFTINNYILFGILIVIFLLIAVRLRPIGVGLFAGGFTAIGSEIVILVAFQIVYGYVYYMYSVIITAFMLGMAIGAYIINRKTSFIKINFFLLIQFAIAVYAIVLPFLILSLNEGAMNQILTVSIFLILILSISVLTGMQFAIAAKIDKTGLILGKKTKTGVSILASETYSADLFGSAFGALLVSGLFIPLSGIVNTCLIMGMINCAALLIIFVWNKIE
jgi:spermidine synthase